MAMTYAQKYAKKLALKALEKAKSQEGFRVAKKGETNEVVKIKMYQKTRHSFSFEDYRDEISEFNTDFCFVSINGRTKKVTVKKLHEQWQRK